MTVQSSNPPIDSSADPFVIRLATAADAAIIARHRSEIFVEMGELSREAYDELYARSMRYFEDALPSGEYVGWLVAPSEAPAQIVAGAGVQIRRLIARPDGRGGVLPDGPQGLIVNVYTEHAWRRRGLAERLMRQIIAWAPDARVRSLVLHASADGRPLYERLGFDATNEMRYNGAL